jgi:hypothetical protein
VPRVYSYLPDELRVALTYALGELEHLPAEGNAEAAASQAVLDPECVAFVGPYRSWEVGETAAIFNEAGMAQLAPAATYSALTRDEPGAVDGMPASLFPTGERTLFRVAVRDAAVCRALVARVPRARLVSDGGEYGEQIVAQLRHAGLQEGDEAIVYAGLGISARPGGDAPVWTLDGAAQNGFPEAMGERARYVMAPRGEEGWPDQDALAFAPQVKEAGMLVWGSAMAGGPTRAGVLAGLRACGRFDEHGDTLERRVGVWRHDGARLVPDGFLEVP